MKMKIPLFLILFSSIFAYSQEVKYINASELNIRSGAGKNYDIVTKATKNETVTVISEKGDWTEIETESGDKGFVSSSYLSNSIITNEDNKIGDYPVTAMILGVLLVFLIFRIKKFINNLFNFSSSKSGSSKRTVKKETKKPEQKIEKKQVINNIPKEIPKKDIVLCKNCGSQYNDIRTLTINNCKNSDGKHQLYEGTIKSQYSCKYCGSKYNSIFQMTINNCKKSATGKHQPAL